MKNLSRLCKALYIFSFLLAVLWVLERMEISKLGLADALHVALILSLLIFIFNLMREKRAEIKKKD
jgi:uncharacterized membrane protein YadS